MDALGGLARRHPCRGGGAGDERAYGTTRPADLRLIVADAGEPVSGGQALKVTVTNVGGTSAANVIVEVTVGDVTREMNLDLVAKGDAGSATVVFPAVATGEPHAEVVSYTNP